MGGMYEDDDEGEMELSDVYCFDQRTGKVNQKLNYVNEGTDLNKVFNFAHSIRMFGYNANYEIITLLESKWQKKFISYKPIENHVKVLHTILN